jgi:hypothetical protein
MRIIRNTKWVEEIDLFIPPFLCFMVAACPSETLESTYNAK